VMQENTSKLSCNKIIVTNNNDVSNETTNVSSDNITMNTINKKKTPRNN
jgi:hypothetical protein